MYNIIFASSTKKKRKKGIILDEWKSEAMSTEHLRNLPA